jgi:hypothetical protein
MKKQTRINILLKKLIVAEVTKKLPAFYRIRKFITVSTKTLILVTILNQMTFVGILTSITFKILFNIILLSKTGLLK